jgi:glutathione reductase (NADPH)
MNESYDLLVLGAGSGGLAASKRAAAHGARVAIVEGDRVGGTCVIRGCVPKKLLVYGSAVGSQLADAASYGWRLPEGTPHCDTAALLTAVRSEVDRLNTLHIGFLEKAGVELVRGWGRFVDPHTLAVADQPGGPEQRRLSGTNVLIAVGGRPQRPAIPGAELGWVSDDLFLLERFPSRMVVLGGGYIACEFACLLRGLGVEVTQLVRADQLLRGFDRELAVMLAEAMGNAGIDLRLGEAPLAIEGSPGDLRVATSSGATLTTEAVLLATGRRPFLAGLELEAAGVAVQGSRIPVDADQHTNVPHIHAVGDVTDQVNLTPVAIDEGRALADALFAGRQRRVNHDLVAKAVFSQPEIATVGLSEEEAIERHGAEAVVVHRARFRPMSRALPGSGGPVLLKLVVLRESGLVLGCHMLGEHAAEIIQMAAIAVGMGATKADFDRTMALHPSISEEFVTL